MTSKKKKRKKKNNLLLYVDLTYGGFAYSSFFRWSLGFYTSHLRLSVETVVHFLSQSAYLRVYVLNCYLAENTFGDMAQCLQGLLSSWRTDDPRCDLEDSQELQLLLAPLWQRLTTVRCWHHPGVRWEICTAALGFNLRDQFNSDVEPVCSWREPTLPPGSSVNGFRTLCFSSLTQSWTVSSDLLRGKALWLQIFKAM